MLRDTSADCRWAVIRPDKAASRARLRDMARLSSTED
jgi:hypothetical protein